MSEDKRVDSTVNMTGDTNVDNAVDNSDDTNMDNSVDSVLTIARAAMILGVSEDYVRRLIEHGIIMASPRIAPSDAHNHGLTDEHNNEHNDGDDVLITARALHDYQARHEAAARAYHEDTAHIDENKLWAIEDTLRAMDDAAIITSEDLKALTDILNS